MAAETYGAPAGSVHASGRYASLRVDHGAELRDLQYRYRDAVGRWRGGIVVSDPAGWPGTLLFGSS